MKTLLIELIDELNKRGFTLKEVSELPSEVISKLGEKYGLETTDKVMSRIFNNKYQIIIPEDENELKSVDAKYTIFDPDTSDTIDENFGKSQDKVSASDLILLDAYSQTWISKVRNNLSTYSKANQSKTYSDLEEFLDKLGEGPVTVEQVKELSPIVSKYSEDADLTEVLNIPYDEIVSVTSTETEPQSEPPTDPEVSTQTEPLNEPDLSTQSSEPSQVESSPEPVPENSSEEQTPEVTNEPEVAKEPEVEMVTIEKAALDEILNRVDKLESAFTKVMSDLGISESSARESLVSYGQRMYRMAHTPMGGELL